jgi:hypothetical protein
MRKQTSTNALNEKHLLDTCGMVVAFARHWWPVETYDFMPAVERYDAV